MKFKASFLLSSSFLVQAIQARNDDQFNYRGTDSNPSGNGNDYGPAQWEKVTCDNIETCLGFPDEWKGASDYISWRPDTNMCKSCPKAGNSCGVHHQSPIDLERNRAIPNNPFTKECPDWHWMRYEDGSCTWDDVVANKRGATDTNNFHIHRHALQIKTPVTKSGELACKPSSDGTPKYPKADYSKGFPDWFFLDHTDIIVPSAHTQEGKQYDAEVHLQSFYEVDDIVKNKLGTIALFLEGVDGIANFEFLDKLICQWRETEDKTRAECGLPSVADYPGCRNPIRGRVVIPTPRPTVATTRRPNVVPSARPPTIRPTVAPDSLYIPFFDLFKSPTKSPLTRNLRVDSTHTDEEMREEESNVSEVELESEGNKREPTAEEEEAYIASIDEFRRREAMNTTERNHRHLLNYDHVPYNAYEWMLAVKTEYYFRYEGTLTNPPCSDIIHWRIMKDPIRVNPMQIKELERLLARRVAPKGSSFKECQVDTAGKSRSGRGGDAVDLNRPLQSTHRNHRMVFCECQDWKSKWPEDQKWCRKGDNKWYNAPYGYSTQSSTTPAF